MSVWSCMIQLGKSAYIDLLLTLIEQTIKEY